MHVKEIQTNLFTENKPPVDENCSTKNEKQDLKALVDEQNRNRTKVMCRRCQGVVFGPKRAVLLEGKDPQNLREMSVGGMTGKEIEKTSIWWYITNEFAFDTIGLLTVEDNFCVLMCGDCEFGPIGWYTYENKKFWVAVERMKYA